MTKAQLINKASRAFHKVGFQLRKHSPEILVVTGTIGVVASAIMACKATLKVNEVTTPAKENIVKINEAMEKGQTQAGEEYSQKDGKKDMAIVYANTGLKLAKLYGPSVLLGAASIGCIITSHGIIRKRNVALAAAYASVDKGFKEYRGRVIERFGEELDKELKFNIKKQEVEEKVVNEDGTETTVKKTIEVIDPNNYSPYAKCFEAGNPGWTKDPEDNLFYLRQQQNWANDLLKAKGHLFLNEVYELLGFPKTKAGNIVGWIYDEKNPIGDNFVDFGIYDIHKPSNRDFVNGYERSIWLDFNVDGNIWDLLP